MSLGHVGVNLVVGSDGSSLGGLEFAHGGLELDLGEAELLVHVASVLPGFTGSGSGSSVSGGSTLLVVDHSLEVSDSLSEDISPVVGSSQGGLSLSDGHSSAASPVFEGSGHFVDVFVSSVNSILGDTDRMDGSTVMGVGSFHGTMGNSSSSGGSRSVPLGSIVSSDGSVVGSDSSLESHGESMHKLLDVASVVVGSEVGESLVMSVGDESHVLLHESSSGSLSMSVSGHAVEERSICEVSLLDRLGAVSALDLLLVEDVVFIYRSDLA